MDLLRKCLLHLFFFLWIFSVPMSLSWHYNVSQGLIHGMLVDYRVPQIHISAILFLLFLATLLVTSKLKHSLVKLNLIRLQDTMKIALLSTILFQSIVSLYQLHYQQSLTGYIPFGESQFTSNQIAKGANIFGQIYKLPYGTTVHPNILAGFAVIFFLILLSLRPKSRKAMYILFCCTVAICFYTQSLSASTALIIGIFLHLTVRFQRGIFLWFLKIACILFPVLVAVLFLLPSIQSIENESIHRRAQLERISIRMIAAQPLFGIGFNTFTAQMDGYGVVDGQIRFLQPVHHVFLLLIAELGIFGWVIICMFLIFIFRTSSLQLQLIFPLVILASFDHYLLTITTGRMIVILVLLSWYIRGAHNFRDASTS